MSAATPGKLQRALAGCCSLIKGSKRTFNFKGLLLKDNACCKVDAIQNKTIFAGPNFAVSYNSAIPRSAGICTWATDRKRNILCIKAGTVISITDLPPLSRPPHPPLLHFSPFTFFPSFCWKNLKLLLLKLEIPHFRAVDVQYHTFRDCATSVYPSASSVFLCPSGLVRSMFPC